MTMLEETYKERERTEKVFTAVGFKVETIIYSETYDGKEHLDPWRDEQTISKDGRSCLVRWSSQFKHYTFNRVTRTPLAYSDFYYDPRYKELEKTKPNKVAVVTLKKALAWMDYLEREQKLLDLIFAEKTQKKESAKELFDRLAGDKSEYGNTYCVSRGYFEILIDKDTGSTQLRFSAYKVNNDVEFFESVPWEK